MAHKSGLDCTELYKYARNFHKSYLEFSTWLRGFMLQRGLEFIAGVKPRTPVKTGDLRAKWQLDEVVFDGHDCKCYFSNPQEYASYVEYGHAKPYRGSGPRPHKAGDWVMGFFMMEVTLDEIYLAMPSKFEAEFVQFCKSGGIY